MNSRKFVYFTGALRRRAVTGLAAATCLTMAVTIGQMPSYAEAPSGTPSLAQGDVISSLAAARATGKSVKIDDATTETSEYFATPDGTVTGRISAGKVRFRRDGAWVPLDLTLRRQADGSLAPTAYPDNLRLSGARTASSGDLASMGTGAQQITVGWQGALPEPRLDGSTATYPDVFPGVDLVVKATTTGFEQLAVLKSAAAAKYASEISLPMSGSGAASVTPDKQGRLSLSGANGQQRASVPTPMMWDSQSAKAGGPPRRRQVTAAVTQTGSTLPASASAVTGPITMTLKPDQKWLTSPDTVYPVTIDPYYDWSTTAVSMTVVKGYPTGFPDSDSLFVGTYDSTWSSRSFITWYANALQGKWVESATAHFANPFSNSCDQKPWEMWATGPITNDTSWDNQPVWQSLEGTSTETSCGDDWITADATSFFRRAVDNGITTPTMGLRANDETDYSQYKQLWSYNYSDPSKFPYVEVNFTDTPASGVTAGDANAMQAQDTFIQAADKISSAVDASNPTGFTSIELTANAVTLWWKGAVTAGIQNAIDQARTIAPVTVSQAPFSKAELETRADQIRTGMQDPSSTVESLSLPVDGSGIVVGTDDGAAPKSAAVFSASSSNSIPVTYVQADPLTPMAGPSTRTNDGWNGTKYSSFAGGGKISSTVPSTGQTVTCTAGFGVTSGSQEFLLTAGHCGYPNQTWKNGNGSRTIGNVSNESAKLDLMLIRTDANRFMWDGGATSGSFTKTVTAWNKAYVGQQVCLSGATTGTHCGWKNTRNLDASYCISKDVYSGKKECYDDLVVAQSSTLASGPGDSGGAIFVTNGGPTVRAVGTLSGGSALKGGGHNIVYQDFWTANRQWNIVPIT